jgi:4-hydroxymandelate oxidase
MRTFVPHAAADAAPAGWGVRRAARLDFPEPAALAADPVHTGRLRVYLTDLLRPYGLALDEAALARGGQSYAEMGEALIALAVPPGEAVDLLVLAYAVPDIAPGRATTTRLSHVCPGAPMAFAVTDQSATAPFTALRLIRAYACAAGMSRALLLIAEQPSVPYDAGLPRTLPLTASAAAFVLGPASPFPLTLPTALPAHGGAGAMALPAPGGAGGVTPLPARGRVGADTVLPALGGADAATALPAPGGVAAPGALPAGGEVEAVGALIAAAPGPVTAILGPGLTPAAAPGAHRVRTADPGRPTTGVWWELAAEVAAMQDAPAAAPPHLLVADRDPSSGTLSLVVLTPALEPAVSGRYA